MSRKSNMERLIPSIVSGAIAAALVIACTGDDPAAVSDAPERGSLGGECLANGSCNAGLACVLVDGKAKCSNTTMEAGSIADSSSSSSSGAPDDDSGVHCNLSGVTSSVCPDKVACYIAIASNDSDAGKDAADASTCIEAQNNCQGTDLRWECNSPHYGCGSCCITAKLVPAGQACSVGFLDLIAGEGTKCGSDPMCQPGKVQLCQANGQCPKGQHCSTVKVQGAYGIHGTILAACVP